MHPPLVIDHRHVVTPHTATARRVVCGFCAGADVGIHFGIRLDTWTGRELFATETVKRFLHKHFTCQTNGRSHFFSVLLGAHVVKDDGGRVFGVG